MTQQQVDKTVIWVLSGASGLMLMMVAYFLVKVDTNIDSLNRSVNSIEDNQIEMKADIKYIKFDTLKLQTDVESLKNNSQNN